jgi:putative PIN family toxin of toxin-antitoxin system
VNKITFTIVVDTNIWISALINPTGLPARLVRAVLEGHVHLVLSAPLLAEAIDVTHRQRIRRRILLGDDEMERFWSRIEHLASLVAIPGVIRLCRDPKDDMIIETAIEGNAHYIVSRDEDLTRDLDLVDTLTAFSIEVTTVARLLALLEQGVPDRPDGR